MEKAAPLLKASEEQKPELMDHVVERELTYTRAKVELAPQNPSPWNYLRGVLRVAGRDVRTERPFAERFADLDREDEVRSSHALDFLADVYAEGLGETSVESGDVGTGKGKDVAKGGERDKAGKALELLARRYDPIRRNYWNWRRGLIGLAEVRG